MYLFLWKMLWYIHIQSINLIPSVCPIKMTNSALKTEFESLVPPTKFLHSSKCYYKRTVIAIIRNHTKGILHMSGHLSRAPLYMKASLGQCYCLCLSRMFYNHCNGKLGSTSADPMKSPTNQKIIRFRK